MPKSPTGKIAATEDERLRQLIQLKRLERPDAQYWQRFEQEFRSKQLSSLVCIQPWHERLRRLALLGFRKAAAPTAAAGALTLTFVAVTQTQYFVKEPSPPTLALAQQETPAPAQAVFLVQQEPEQALAASKNAGQENASPLGPANYRISVLATSRANPGYQLNAMPVSFSSPQTVQQPTAGAKVISTRPQF